jgi:predicted nucleotidyltransferase
MNIGDIVKSTVAYHDLLNPRAWEGNGLRSEVRAKLLQTARRFVNYLEIPNFEVLDVVLTGSMANYNYTRFSDYDLHVITRYSDLECDDLAEVFYRAKKQIWNDEHDIVIYGNEVELYVEDVGQPPVSGGVYSILDGKWIKQPNYEPPNVNDREVQIKARDLVKQIESAIGDGDPAELERLKTKIRHMRRAGLDTAGEFSVENLAFKVLRNLGYMDKLNTAYIQQQDQELSI